MKNTFLKTIGGMALAILMLAMFAPVWVSAQDNGNEQKLDEQTQEDSSKQSGGGRLEGTWDAQVTIRICQTGAAIRTFASIGTFMYGGTMSTRPPAYRKPRKHPDKVFGVMSAENLTALASSLSVLTRATTLLAGQSFGMTQT
ncbi:hypothetical protein BH18ACI1_BH18ACI1_15280 [soil metagenome]